MLEPVRVVGQAATVTGAGIAAGLVVPARWR
jgi:hypothetical protein